MLHPLISFAERLEHRAARKRVIRAGERIEAAPHPARDVGLPYRPTCNGRIDLW